MKTSFKILTAIIGIITILILSYFTLRLVPGGIAFALAHNLAVDAGLDDYAALAIGLIAGTIPIAFLLWRGFSWRKVPTLLAIFPFVLGAYFATKSFLLKRSREIQNPDAAQWFAFDRPVLYYARQPDDTLIFSASPGISHTGLRLHPVTSEIYWEWHQLQKKKKAAMHKEESDALNNQLADQALITKACVQEWAIQLQEELGQEKLKRARMDLEFQKQLDETRLLAGRAQAETSEAKSKLEELSRRALEIKADSEERTSSQFETEVQRRIKDSVELAEKVQSGLAEVKDEIRTLARQASQPQSLASKNGTEHKNTNDQTEKSNKAVHFEEKFPQTQFGRTSVENTSARIPSKLSSCSPSPSTSIASITTPKSPGLPIDTPLLPGECDVTIQIRNATLNSISINFTSCCRYTWPSYGDVFNVEAGKTFFVSLSVSLRAEPARELRVKTSHL